MSSINSSSKRSRGKSSRFRLPCGKVISLKNGESPDSNELELSTKMCFDARYKCTNPDGHKIQARTGTPRNPHIKVKCSLEPIQMSGEFEVHLVKRFASSHWPSVYNVYWHESSVYEAVDRNDAFVGYILLPGAPETYMRSDLAWKFYNPK